MSNLSAFLTTLGACEGTGDCYGALFGYTPTNGRTFSDFSRHPNIRFAFKQTDGQVNYTTAAGRYQIIFPTYARLSKKLGLTDFSAPTQDAMATELIAERGAIADVKEGRLEAAMAKCAPEWASLPTSTAAQPRRSYKYASNVFAMSGGVIT